jgi:hypothetical protein
VILATRIPNLTEHMRQSALRADATRARSRHPEQHLIDYLERRGYRVIRPTAAA